MARLSDTQIKRLWEEWIGAETRSHYFAELSQKYQRKQRVATILNLAFSSGAAVLFFSSVGLAPYAAIVAAIIAAYILVEQNHARAIEASKVHSKWNRIALDCTRLWENWFSEEATGQLQKIEDSVSEASEASGFFLYKEKAMRRWQELVEAHHGFPKAA